MGFGQIRWRPLRGMVGMGVIEADDIFATLAALTLNRTSSRGSML